MLDRRGIALAAFFIAGLLAVRPVFADDQPVDPKIAEAERKQKIAEAQKAAAEAERDALKARLGELSADRTPKNQITADKVEIEGRLLATRAVSTAVCSVAHEIAALNPKPTLIVLYASKPYNDLATYRAFTGQASLLLAELKRLQTLPPLATSGPKYDCGHAQPKALAAPLLVLDAALQLASLFNRETTVAGQEVSIDDTVVQRLAIGDLQRLGITTIDPQHYAPHLFSAAPTASAVLKLLDQLRTERTAAANFSSTTLAQEKAARAAALKKQKDATCAAVLQADIDTLSAREADIKAAGTELDAIFAALLKADAQTGLRILDNLLSAEDLATGAPNAYTLDIKTTTAGANTIATKNILRSHLQFSGGAALTYLLVKGDGTPAAAGIRTQYGGTIDEKNLPTALLTPEEQCK